MNNRTDIKFRLSTFIVIFTMYSVSSFGQDTTATDKKISYSFITEHGLCLGNDITGYEGILVNGVRINRTQDEIGIGTGCEYGITGILAVPIFANYRHYFPSKTNLKLFLNFSAGTRIGSLYLESTWKSGLYTVVTTGFTVKAFSFSSGFYVKSFDGMFFSGIEIKLGCTFKK